MAEQGNFQTRGDISGLQFFNSLREALDFARAHGDVWKISFFVKEERVRLLRSWTGWHYEDIDGKRD